MNLLPIELYLVLVGVIPLGVCFAKWKFGMSWIVASMLCAGASWIYFNLWMGMLDPLMRKGRTFLRKNPRHLVSSV
jgi:hypothetical protein